MNNLLSFLISRFLSFFSFPYELLTNWNLLRNYLLSIFFIVIMYLLIAVIYCSIFKIAYIKFFQSTIFPIIGLIILIIQGIIYIFFLPYYIFVVVKNTFEY